jgi:hypothetical protein
MRRLNPRETVIRGTKEGSLMIDIIIAIALLLGTGTISQGPSGPMGPVPAPMPPADALNSAQ